MAREPIDNPTEPSILALKPAAPAWRSAHKGALGVSPSGNYGEIIVLAYRTQTFNKSALLWVRRGRRKIGEREKKRKEG